METVLKVATRGSKLALRQYDIISEILESHGLKCMPVETESHGEQDAGSPLYSMKEQGIFVKKLNNRILEGEADIAVHSAKDIPNEIDERLTISYFSRRADPRDYLISRFPLDGLKGTVGSSSIRRRRFLSLANRNLNFVNLRGNINTRIDRWESGKFDSIVVAKAALDRLGLSPPGEVLSEEICPPDPNQGFIAIVAEKGSEIDRKLREMQDAESLWEASRERDLMRKLQLGCSIAVSVRALYVRKVVKFAYASEENRFDLTLKGEIGPSEIRKMRDVIEQ